MSARPSTATEVRELLISASAALAGTPWRQALKDTADDLGGPLRIAFAGPVNAGKSTLLNALVGQRVAPTDSSECTRVVTAYEWADEEVATVTLRSRPHSVERVQLRRQRDRLTVELGSLQFDEVAMIHVGLPTQRLSGLTLVDTPGTGSMANDREATTKAYLLEGASTPAPPHAAVYLMRRIQSTDVAFLEAFRDPQTRAGRSLNAVTVLSRADEIGGGRSDAMPLARIVADTCARDPRLRQLTQAVIPVSGLVAETATTLTNDEFEDLCVLADLAPRVMSAMLLSTDRFGAANGCPVPAERRRGLLRRLGLVGLLWAIDWLRLRQDASTEPADAEGLADHLEEMSGLHELRDVLRSQITERRDVLKADVALDRVERALRDHGIPEAAAIASEVERIRLRTNGFGERQLLESVHAGSVQVSADMANRIERLLGARGGSPAVRLNLAADASAERLVAQATDEHHYWSSMAADPLAPPELTRAAAVLVRTCESLLSDVSHG